MKWFGGDSNIHSKNIAPLCPSSTSGEFFLPLLGIANMNNNLVKERAYLQLTGVSLKPGDWRYSLAVE